MTVLLDANVLTALVVKGHVHHDAAEAWFAASAERFATCPITEGSLVRMLIRGGQSAGAAKAMLTTFADHHRHEFWSDDLSYRDADLGAVDVHAQVTDAYLAELARSRNARVATFDQRMALLHQGIVELVPTA